MTSNFIGKEIHLVTYYLQSKFIQDQSGGNLISSRINQSLMYQNLSFQKSEIVIQMADFLLFRMSVVIINKMP